MHLLPLTCELTDSVATTTRGRSGGAREQRGVAMRSRKGGLRRALLRLWRDRDGAAVLEFALVLPPLCLILIGMFEVAMVTFCQASMEGALREAARYGITGQDEATIDERKAKILDIVDHYTLGLFDIADATVTTKIYSQFADAGGTAIGEPITYDANHDGDGNGQYDDPREDAGERAEIVEYTVEYDWPLMTPFMAHIMGNAQGKIPLKASVVLRNEPWNVE
jgi:Flp pilus assembly pilin Flp